MRFLEDNGVLYEEQGPVMWRCEGCGSVNAKRLSRWLLGVAMPQI